MSTAWQAFSLQVLEPPPIHMTMAFTDHVLSSPVSGVARLRRQVGGRAVDGWSHPGTMILTPAHLDAMWDADGTNRLVFLHMPHAFFSRVIAEEWNVDPKGIEIIPQFLARDPVVEWRTDSALARDREWVAIWTAVRREWIRVLARHIVHVYSSLSKPPRSLLAVCPRVASMLSRSTSKRISASPSRCTSLPSSRA